MSVQDFVSRVTLTDAQREVLPTLEPSFEHLLDDAKVDPATILALRHCQITDRETVAALDDTVDGLKTVALDMGIDLLGGMPHKREFARITTAWKKARAQADIKVTTEALQRQHGEPIAMYQRIGQASWSNSRKSTAQISQTRNSQHKPTTRTSRSACRQVCSVQSPWTGRSRGTGTSKAGPTETIWNPP